MGFGRPIFGFGQPIFGFGRPIFGLGRPIFGFGRPLPVADRGNHKGCPYKNTAFSGTGNIAMAGSVRQGPRGAPTGEVWGGRGDAVERALRWPMREGVASAHWKIAPPEGELPQAGADAVRRPRLAGLGTSPSVAARQLPLGGSDWIGLLGGRFQGGIFARGSGGRGDQGGRSPDSVGHSLRPTGERVTSSFPGGWRGLGILLRGRWDCHQGV